MHTLSKSSHSLLATYLQTNLHPWKVKMFELIHFVAGLLTVGTR